MGILRLRHASARLAAPSIDPDSTHDLTRSDQSDGEELRRLSDSLTSLLARDGDDPPLWWSASFARRVESARSVIANVTSGARLSAGLSEPGPAEITIRGRYESDARWLARDAVAVAIAIRWLELCHEQTLPPWQEILRGRSVAPRAADRRVEVALWFG